MNVDNINNTSTEAEGEYTVKRRRALNHFAKIMSLFAAIVIWIYAVETESPAYEDTFQVPVTITGVPSGLSVISGGNITVELTVRGKRSEINAVDVADIEVIADASEVTGEGIYSLTAVNTVLPGNLMLVDIYPESVSVYLGTTASKQLPISVELRNYTVEAGYTLESTLNDVTSLTVRGPKNELEKITRAVVIIEPGRISSSITASGTVTLIGENGEVYSNPYVTANVTNVLVRIDVHTYKTIPLTVDFKYGYLDSDSVDIKLEPSTVTLKGTVESLEGIDSINVYTVDETVLNTDTTTSVGIDIPSGIQLIDSNSKVKITIKHKNTQIKAVVVDLSRLQFDNVPEGLEFEVKNAEFNVILRGGDGESFSKIGAQNITLLADLSDLSGITGDVTVPLKVVVSNPYDGAKIYAVGSYVLTLTVK